MSEKSVSEEAREILRLAGEATPGPWYALGPPWGDGGFVVAGSDDPHQGTYVCNTDDELMLDEHDERGSANTVADADYIAAANPEAVQKILREFLRVKEGEAEERSREREWEAFCRESDVRCVYCGLRYGERKQYGCIGDRAAHHYDEAELVAARNLEES